MLLLDFNTTSESPWICSTWQLTYKVSWNQICKAAEAIKKYYDSLEIFIDNTNININEQQTLLSLPEGSNLTIRGLSKILNIPIMITFTNQVQAITVYSTQRDKTIEVNYKSINYELCQYLDSIELAMHR